MSAAAPTIASLFFRNRPLLILAISIILVSGFSAFNSLPRLEDPRITNRAITILTLVPGASAERVETLITEPLETGLQEIKGIKDIESTSTAGISLVAVELAAAIDDSQNKGIFSEVRDKAAEIEAGFPPEALPVFIDDKREAVAFTLLTAVGWEGQGEANLTLMNRVAEELANRLRTVSGTDLVRVYAAPSEEILVEIDSAEIAALGLTAQQVASALQQADVKQPAGTYRGLASNVNIEVQGQLDSAARIASVPLISGAGATVKVGDVAAVSRHWQEPESSMGLVDGRRVIFVAVRMGSERRVEQWAAEANAVVDSLQQEIGSGISLDSVFQQERYTTGLLTSLVSNLVAGAGVVVAVIFIMMGWRLALVVSSVLPLVTAMVLFSLQLAGNTIHQMSVFGMIIAIGLLIDNGIVVADEIMQHRRRGDSALDSVEKSVRHLFVPLLASTVTTGLAFAPILLLPGSAGDFVGSIGSTVITAVSSSFLVAITIIAALAGIFAEPAPEAGPGQAAASERWWRSGLRPEGIIARYRAALRAALRNPIAAILLAIAWPLLGFVAAGQLGNQFFPPVDRDMFQLEVTLPAGTSIEATERQARLIEARIRDFEATEHVFWVVGGSFPSVYYNLIMNKDNAAYYANAIVTASSNAEAKAMIAPLQEALNEEFSDAQIVIRQFGQGPPVVTDIEYRLYGPSIERLQSLGEEIRLVLQAHPEVIATSVTMPRGEPKLWFDVDEDEARLAGLSLQAIAAQLQTNLEGSLGGSVIENLERLPVRVRYDSQTRANLADIEGMQFVVPGSNEWVAAQSLGSFELRPELGGITRFNAQRTNRVQAYTQNESLPLDITQSVLAELTENGFQLPTGYRLELGGAAEQEGEATGDLMIYVPLLVTLTIATLILLFGSGALALLLGVVAVLSMGLGLFATWAMSFPISFNSLLGILGLVGLAFNNSIVVLAAIRADAQAFVGNREAIVEAVMGSTRHILSTTLTTIGGFLPLLIFVGGDFWPSLSIVLVGGVGGSMILALLMVPASYALLHRGGDESNNGLVEASV